MRRTTAQALVALAATGFVAAATRVGPVILTVSPKLGVHAGDLIPAAVLVAIVSIETAVRAVVRR